MDFRLLPTVDADLLLDPVVAEATAIAIGVIALLAAVFLLLPLLDTSLRMYFFRRALSNCRTEMDLKRVKVSGTLGQTWRDFLDEWRGSSAVVGDKRVSPVHFGEHLDVSQFMSRWRLNLVDPMSGILLALGIFFTFLGITLGLRQIDTSEPDLLLEGVRQLLQGMTFAFITSIAGILLSIMWIGAAKLSRGSFSQSRSKLLRAVHEHFPWRPADEIHQSISLLQGEDQRAILEGQSRLLEDQKTSLQTLGTDIATVIQDSFEASLRETIVPALEGLTDGFAGFAEQQGAQQQEGVREMVAEFREQLQGGMKEYFEQLSAAIARSGDYMESFNQSSERTLQHLKELTEVQEGLLSSTSEAAREFSEGLAGVGQLHDRISTSIGQFDSVSRTLLELSEGMKGEAQVLSEANSELRTALADQLEEVTEQVELLRKNSGRFESTMEELVPNLEGAVTEFSGLAADKLKEVFRVFDHEMASVTSHLGGTLEAIRESLDELTPSAVTLRDSVSEMNGPAREAAVLMERLSADLRQSAEATGRLFSALQNGRNSSAETEPEPDAESETDAA